MITPRPLLGLDQIVEIERRFAEKLVGALCFQLEQAALDGAGAGGGDVAVLRFELVGIVGNELQHRAKIFQIEQEQPVLVRDPEHHVEDALLRVIQAEQPAEEQRPHLRNRRAHRMPVLAKDIPENDRAGFAFEIGDSQLLEPAPSTFGLFPPAWLIPARSPFTSAMKTGMPRALKFSASVCRRHGLARAGRAGDEAMAVRHFRQEIDWFRALRDKDWVVHERERKLCLNGRASVQMLPLL